MLIDPDGNATKFLITLTDELRGVITIQYYKDKTLLTKTLKLRANQLAVLEERMGMGPRDMLTSPGIRLAREIIYVGYLHQQVKGWNPFQAGNVFDDLSDCGAGYSDVCEPFARLLLKSMPEARRFLEEQGLYKSTDGEGAAKSDPTGSAQTGESTGPSSSSTQEEQG